MTAEEPPFSLASQLNPLELKISQGGAINTENKHRPMQPHIKLADIDSLESFLLRHLCTPVLDRLAPYLYMIATPSSSSVSPLHLQKVKNRQIILTEDLKLHLVSRSNLRQTFVRLPAVL